MASVVLNVLPCLFVFTMYDALIIRFCVRYTIMLVLTCFLTLSRNI